MVVTLIGPRVQFSAGLSMGELLRKNSDEDNGDSLPIIVQTSYDDKN